MRWIAGLEMTFNHVSLKESSFHLGSMFGGHYQAEIRHFYQTDEDTVAYVPQNSTIIPPKYHNNSLPLWYCLWNTSSQHLLNSGSHKQSSCHHQFSQWIWDIGHGTFLLGDTITYCSPAELERLNINASD